MIERWRNFFRSFTTAILQNSQEEIYELLFYYKIVYVLLIDIWVNCFSKPNPGDVWMNKPMVLLVHPLEDYSLSCHWSIVEQIVLKSSYSIFCYWWYKHSIMWSTWSCPWLECWVNSFLVVNLEMFENFDHVVTESSKKQVLASLILLISRGSCNFWRH